MFHNSLHYRVVFCLIFLFLLVETVAIKCSSLGRRTQAEPRDDADFTIGTYIGSLPAALFFSNTLNLYADKQKQITHGTTAQHLCMWMLMRQCLRFTWIFCGCTTACGCPRLCICAWSRVSVHGYFSLKRVCMSTILDRAREGCLSMRVLLSVWSSQRQQGAPFQFTHQPQRQGVKARGITVGDFTFEGQDYQSGDPCEEVMREGDRRGAAGEDGGGVRGGLCDSVPPWNPRRSVFWGEYLPSCTSVWHQALCGVAVRGRLYPFSSLSCPSESKSLNGCRLLKTVIQVETQNWRIQSGATDCKWIPFVSAFFICTAETI